MSIEVHVFIAYKNRPLRVTSEVDHSAKRYTQRGDRPGSSPIIDVFRPGHNTQGSVPDPNPVFGLLRANHVKVGCPGIQRHTAGSQLLVLNTDLHLVFA